MSEPEALPEPVEFVRPRVRVDGPVVLHEADDAWPVQYAEQERRIRTALRSRALLVEHVGSTSIPGLAAKPILDIVLAVDDPADEAAYVPDLEAAGYLLHIREPGWRQHRLFKGEDPHVNLHVFADGDPEIDRMLTFRDWLRAEPSERSTYEATKRELARRQWDYVQGYADAKAEVVEGILVRAAQA
jgi:GrpB-like predicted nucleotidyltransferase (UPF0157 family)